MRHFIVAAFALALTLSEARAVPISESQTGMTVDAPGGYTITGNNGFYQLQNSKVYARFMLARSPYNLKKTVDTYVKAAKLRTFTKKSKGKAIEVKGKVRGKNVTITFTPVSTFIDIVTIGDRGKKRRAQGEVSNAEFVRPPVLPITVGEVLQLKQILQTRRGGITVPLQINIPMRRFVAPDGKSSALVPNLPGWTFSGGGGELSGFNVNQGAFNFGTPVVVSDPRGPFPEGITNLPVPPGQAIVDVWPQFVRQRSGLNVVVTSVVAVPGTQGWLGPNFISGMYAVRLTLNGVPWTALFVSGSFDIGSSLGWGWYHTYIAVPAQGPGGIGPALMNSWATWDNSVASNERLNQALASILTTRVGGGPIDWDVFEKAAHDWDSYIRGDE